MKAMQVVPSTIGPVLSEAEVPQPVPATSDVVVRVHATGVTPSELKWYPTSHRIDGSERRMAIPGHEFSGVLVAVGTAIDEFQVGDEIFGMNDWYVDGATAEYCIAKATSIIRKPKSLTHAEAASIPIGALTAWQGLFDRAALQPGERVLIHGGSGAVGTFAVQLAHQHEAYVISTASKKNLGFVRQLGADEVVDYETTPFEDIVRNIDVVFDCVGGATLERSWGALNPSGRAVTIAAESEGKENGRVKDAFFIVEPHKEQLTELSGQIECGKLKAFVNAEVPFEYAAVAYSGGILSKRGYGKTVITGSNPGESERWSG